MAIFQDKGGGHRWRIRARIGEIFGDSGEAYASRSNVQRALKSVRKTAPDATVEDES
ncbi:MAG: YegP family protein [Chloroflexota bacterium]|nr:YegP family protein [Chloroflexota bacterium]